MTHFLDSPQLLLLAKSGFWLEVWPPLLLGIYCLLIMIFAFIGGWLPQLVKLTHTRMQIILSLVGGLMLGTGLFHMLPHAVHELKSIDQAVLWMMLGVVTLFFLLRMFHFHDHSLAETSDNSDHQHDHHHNDSCSHGHHPHEGEPRKLSWVGIFLGMSLHTLIDGLALGASIQGAASHATGGIVLGLGTFLAIVLHKPLDAIAITSVMSAGGWSSKSQMFVSAGFALMCPLGAILFFFGVQYFIDYQSVSVVVGCALAFSAGVFICISLGDLLPEMEFHSHDRLRLSLALLVGIGISWGIGFLEPDHTHEVVPTQQTIKQ